MLTGSSATLGANNAEEFAGKINEILYKAFEEDFKKSKDCLIIADKILKGYSKGEFS